MYVRGKDTALRRLRWEEKIILDDLVEITNKMQPCIRIYHSTVH